MLFIAIVSALLFVFGLLATWNVMSGLALDKPRELGARDGEER